MKNQEYNRIMKDFIAFCNKTGISECKDHYYDFYEGKGINWITLDHAWDYWFYG